jgi:hypothetical protein
MKVLSFSTILTFFAVFCLSSAAVAGTQYVKVTKAFVNVYETLDPKSPVLKQAIKGDHLKLIYSGEKWYQVEIDTHAGWLERRAGIVVESANTSSIVSIILLVIVCLSIFIAAGYYVYKQKSTQSLLSEEL